MRTLKGSKSDFFKPLNGTTNTSVPFIWEHPSPRDGTVWRDISVNDTDQIFNRRAKSREVYRDEENKN